MARLKPGIYKAKDTITRGKGGIAGVIRSKASRLAKETDEKRREAERVVYGFRWGWVLI